MLWQAGFPYVTPRPEARAYVTVRAEHVGDTGYRQGLASDFQDVTSYRRD